MASSSIVIKVKFGETLRRFSALIHDKKLALDVVMLREKIRSLFGFDSDVDFTLTYVDEDGDEVTLADDDDIHDVVRQSLNPLRITVKLNNGKSDESNGTSTPLRSLNSGVSEILKSVPEPFRDVLAKLPLDLASKASSSAPGIAELVEKLTKTYLNQLSDPVASPNGAADISGQKGKGKKSESSNVNGRKGKNSESLVDKDIKVPVDPEVGKSKSKKKEEQAQKVNEGVKFKDVQPPRAVDLNVPYFEYEAFQTPFNTNKGVELFNGRTYSQVVSDLPSMKNKDTTDGSSESKNAGVAAPCLDYLKHYIQDHNATEMGGLSSAEIPKATNDSGSSSGWAQGMLNATNQCPFAGTPLENGHGLHGFQSSHNPWRRSYNHGNGIGSLFHRGVRCDGCGVHPIIGPRFKSKVKEDYDLCSVCFAGMGNVADYIRLDRPTNFARHHMPFKGFHDPSLRIPPPTLPHAFRAPGAKLPRSKLDSRFILDVNILDGTIMAPFTAFTKIWRMRNNGTVIWPRGSQLQWIGGDRLSNSLSVEIEIPADGLPVDKELDVAVDFMAPELPGRYVSYWRMASPSGQKFGQRVWVLIQVDASMKDLGETSINLNLPPVMRNPEVVDQNQVMDTNSVLPENNFIGVTDSEGWQPKDQEMNFPINDTLIIDNGKDGESSTTAVDSPPPPVGPVIASLLYPTVEADSASTTPRSPPVGPAVSLGLYPTVGGADTGSSVDQVIYPSMEAGPSAPSPTVAVVQPSGSATEEVTDDREVALLRELQEMGFNQADLNKKILRTNNYNLEKSVDDLCGVSEWDPMLEELQEMGFADNEANRRLLKKNNGSIKGVVMDLINGERA
ncbi:hypothetical protein L6452_07238 [Arctium lappa]|uniref:Uncharacterized protein n=1 Tax=Arctium lappa TaxID=4217 RepID=A0ACB9EKA6_ARCLA|nr:hypothetical protein L6452_07238 [Arctium lappa]